MRETTIDRMPDPKSTKRALLNAGRIEFAEHGLAGARTDRIAALSGVNKQRIYPYFGNKEGMFAAVLSDALDSFLGVIPFPDGDLSGGEFLAKYVQAVGAYHYEHPELLRLLQWEALELGPKAGMSTDRALQYEAKVAGFASRLGLSVETAAPLLFGVIGLAAWPHAVPQLGALIHSTDDSVSRELALNWALGAAEALGATQIPAAIPSLG